MSNVISLAEVSSQRKVSIINRYAEKQAELLKVKAELEALKVEAVEVLGEGLFETNYAKLNIKWIEKQIQDSAALKKLLADNNLTEPKRTSSYYDARITFKGQ